MRWDLKERPVPPSLPRRDLPRHRPPIFAYCIANTLRPGPAPGNFFLGAVCFQICERARSHSNPPPFLRLNDTTKFFSHEMQPLNCTVAFTLRMYSNFFLNSNTSSRQSAAVSCHLVCCSLKQWGFVGLSAFFPLHESLFRSCVAEP